jgi:putative transposase
MSRDSRVALLDREAVTTGADRADGLSVRAQSQMLGLNRSGLYYRPQPPSQEELWFKRRIDEIYTARPFYGIRRITVQLQQEGHHVNHKAVTRHMREMGLSAIVPGPHLSRRVHRAADSTHPYLLKGVAALHPNHIWGIDITYIRMMGSYPGWLYLVAVLDWFSRYIVSWQLSQSLGQSFVTAAVRSALSTATPIICNSDQGGHFTSPRYTALLTEAGVQISMDEKGRFADNIFTERLWRTIKYEEVYLHEYSTPRAARQSLGAYIEFYNHDRPHQALDYQTPTDTYRPIATPTTKGGNLTLEKAFSWS